MIYERKDIKDWKALVKEGNIIRIRQWDDMELSIHDLQMIEIMNLLDY